MNATVKTILNRRSIRHYKSKQIADEELQTILEAGMYAPSVRNQQSNYFVVLQNKVVLAELASIAQEVTGKETNPYYNASTIVLVYAKKDNVAAVQDACLAIENMLLAAASLQIGSGWIHCTSKALATDKG